MTYNDPDQFPEPDFDPRAAEEERLERARSRMFWVIAVPFGLMATIAIALDLGMTGVDFVCVWMLCVACLYALFSFTVK